MLRVTPPPPPSPPSPLSCLVGDDGGVPRDIKGAAYRKGRGGGPEAVARFFEAARGGGMVSRFPRGEDRTGVFGGVTLLVKRKKLSTIGSSWKVMVFVE